MITKSDTYSTHGCADRIDADWKDAAVMLAQALTTATNKAEHRVQSARLAFETAAHYERLSKFDELDEYAKSFALRNIDFYQLRGRLLLTERTDEQINAECTRLLKKAAGQ